MSSTVRRCIEKETGKEYAAKIIDLSNENNEGGAEAAAEATRQEVAILRLVAGHPYISKLSILTISIVLTVSFCLKQLNCKMFLNQALLFSLFLNCVKMGNYSTI